MSTISQIYIYIHTSIHVITNSYKHGKCIACSTGIVWVLQLVTLHLPLLFCSGRLRMAVFGISGWRKWSTKRSGNNKSLQIWLILVSEILNLICVALKLFTRLHEVNKEKLLEKWVFKQTAIFSGVNLLLVSGIIYEGVIEITQILADETSKSLEVSKKLGVEHTRSYKMGRYDRYTWSCYIDPINDLIHFIHTQMLNRHGLFIYIWLIW